MEPWYKVALPRIEVREGRSFNPNEFAIALEQVVAGRGPEDYRELVSAGAEVYAREAVPIGVRLARGRASWLNLRTEPSLCRVNFSGRGDAKFPRANRPMCVGVICGPNPTHIHAILLI